MAENTVRLWMFVFAGTQAVASIPCAIFAYLAWKHSRERSSNGAAMSRPMRSGWFTVSAIFATISCTSLSVFLYFALHAYPLWMYFLLLVGPFLILSLVWMAYLKLVPLASQVVVKDSEIQQLTSQIEHLKNQREFELKRASRPSKLTIHSANYAAVEGGGTKYDVADCLRQMICGDSLVLQIENHSFIAGEKNFVPQDPKSDKPKRLQVSYSYDNNEPPVTVERQEHSRLVLPEDSEIRDEMVRLKAAIANNPMQEVANDDAANMEKRVRQVSQRIEFHYSAGSDPYLDIITELWNGTVFQLVNYGEITGHGAYCGQPFALAPRISTSVEPVCLSPKHGESVTLVVRQFLSTHVADMMVANRGRGSAIDFQSISVPFKVLPVAGVSPAPYTWWGPPRFAIEDAKRVLH